MASALQQPSYWRPFALAQVPTAGSLQAMGFDVRRLGFYAWLVSHGKEPVIDDACRISIPRRDQVVGD